MAGSHPSNLSQEFLGFLKKMSEVVYRQEEQKLIAGEVQKLKGCFEKFTYTIEEKRELIIRAVYVEMFGYEAPFARIHAINLAQEKNISAKRTGYLACSLIIPPNDDLILLLINTIQKDLASNSYLEVSAALTSICQLEKKEIVQTTLPMILEIIDNPMSNPFIKRKAYIAVQRFQNYINQFPSITRKCVEDQDINIMFIGLNLLRDLVAVSPGDYCDLVPKLVEILRLIITRQLSHELDYYGTPAPWIQIAILDLLGLIGATSIDCSEHVQGILLSILKNNENFSKAALAVLLQCILTLSKVQASKSLVELASNRIAKYITSVTPNLRYMALVSLSFMAEISPQCVLTHQLTLVDLLNDKDQTISRKTLEIIFKITNETNIQAIVDTLLTFLESCSDPHYQKDLISKVALVSEKYSPNAEWYLDTLISLMANIDKLGFNKSQEWFKFSLDISNQLLQLITSEESQAFKLYSLNKFQSLLDSKSKYLQQMCAWVLGEYGDENTVKVIEKQLNHDIATDLDGYLLMSLIKLKSKGHNVQVDLDNLTASNYTLAQRIHEFKYILSSDLKTLQYELPEGFEGKTRFLTKIAEKALENGAKPYKLPKKFEKIQDFSLPNAGKFYKQMEGISSRTREIMTQDGKVHGPLSKDNMFSNADNSSLGANAYIENQLTRGAINQASNVEKAFNEMHLTREGAINQASNVEKSKPISARWGPDGYKWSKNATNTIESKVDNQPMQKTKSSQINVESKEKDEEREKRAAALFGGLTLN